MKLTILILPGYSQKWEISGESLAQNLTKGKLNKYSALFLVIISRPVWCLILVHFYLSSLFLLFSKIVFGIIATCFYTKKAKISLFSHHWRTSDLVPYVLLLVQTKVSHLSTLAHFNFRARILSWLKLQTRPQLFIFPVLCLLPGMLVSCLLPNSGSLDAMVSQGYLMPGKGGEGDRSYKGHANKRSSTEQEQRQDRRSAIL